MKNKNDMVSKLIITSVEKLQKEITEIVRALKKNPGIYVSLNKTQKSAESALKKEEIDTKKLFFIDCVTEEKIKEDVLHIKPNDLEQLSYAINRFIDEIPGEKFLIIDALSTLLIYNNENKVAAFVKEITEYASKSKINVIAISPKTRGEELLNKIFNFFDEVNKTEEDNEKTNENNEEWVY